MLSLPSLFFQVGVLPLLIVYFVILTRYKLRNADLRSSNILGMADAVLSDTTFRDVILMVVAIDIAKISTLLNFFSTLTPPRGYLIDPILIIVFLLMAFHSAIFLYFERRISSGKEFSNKPAQFEETRKSALALVVRIYGMLFLVVTNAISITAIVRGVP